MPETAQAPRPKIPRWRYVVPNAITCIGLLIGLTACFRAFEQDYLEAAWLIVLCVLIDKLDGTAARLLNATSDIGVQLDSFSDFVTFGIAPGTLVFSALWSSRSADFAMWQGPATGWVLRGLVAAYVLCACIRLAKFNVLTVEEGPAKIFYGMPTTFAGGAMATCFILGLEYEATAFMAWLPVLAAVLAAAMVSNVPIPKVAKRESMAVNAFQGLVVACGYVCGIARILPEFLAAVMVLYGVGGFAWGFANRRRLAPRRSLDPYPE